MYNHKVFAEDADFKLKLKLTLRHMGITYRKYIEIISDLLKNNGIGMTKTKKKRKNLLFIFYIFFNC